VSEESQKPEDVVHWMWRRNEQPKPCELSEEAKRSKKVLRRFVKDFENAKTGMGWVGNCKLSLSFAKDSRTNFLNRDRQYSKEWKLSIEWRPFGTAERRMSVWLGWERENNASRHNWETALTALSEAHSIIETQYRKQIADWAGASQFARNITDYAKQWATVEAHRVQAEVERAALLESAKSTKRRKAVEHAL
jgi:hypothetical protein